MQIGDEVYIHGFVDEIRKDTVIIRNKGGYFGTDAEEVAPTVDAAEVVRCKDCKHWNRTDNLPEHYGECLDSVFGYCAPREDFFCKAGERRSE